MTIIRRQGINVLAAAAAMALAACGGSGSDSGTAPADATGFLSLAVSDGPIHSAQKVCITFDAVELKPADGDSITIDLEPPEKVDLLDFQGANAMPILTNEEFPAGELEWLRLYVDAMPGSNGGAGDTLGDDCDGEASYIVMDDETVHNLWVPSGDQSGLKLVGGYTIPSNDLVSLTAEFDLGKSITAPPGLSPDVILRPTIRLVDNNEVGTLTGQVASELAETVLVVDEEEVPCEPSVYVFDDGVVPNPIEDDPEAPEDPEDPVATAMVEAQDPGDGTTEYHYTVGFLVAGEYEAAFTCDGATFEPEEGKQATIVAGEITTVDFEAPPAE